jgi:hypothetical protein
VVVVVVVVVVLRVRMAVVVVEVLVLSFPLVALPYRHCTHHHHSYIPPGSMSGRGLHCCMCDPRGHLHRCDNIHSNSTGKSVDTLGA